MVDPQDTETDLLALNLVRCAVHNNTVSYSEIVPLLRRLLPPSSGAAHSPYALLCLLQGQPDTDAAVLAKRIHTAILSEAARVARRRQSHPEQASLRSPLLAHLPPDIPGGWPSDKQGLNALRAAAQLERDRAFALAKAPALSHLIRAIHTDCEHQRTLLRKPPSRWRLFPPSLLWADLTAALDTEPPPTAAPVRPDEESARLAELADLAAQAYPGYEAPPALQALVSWPSAAAAPFLRQVGTRAPAWQTFIEHALACRTGLEHQNWPDWDHWLEDVCRGLTDAQAEAALLAQEFRDELRLLWLRDQPGSPDPALEAELEAAARKSSLRTTASAAFVRRWEQALTPAEARMLSGAVPEPASPPPLPALPATQAYPPSPRPAATRPPPTPTLWETHIHPFLTGNWYIIAGLLMVIAGASLLAYFTWDKSALVRYLFLPLLLGAFTAGLAELGLRLFRRHEALRVAGTFLTGGAVCLLPVNFMVLCRAGADPQAGRLILPAFALYAALAGLGLWRWCGALRPELRLLLGLPLLLVNLLAVAGDMPGLREASAAHSATLVPATVTAAVLLLLAAANRFLWRVLDAEMLAAKLVPWFFGVTLTATTLQVVVWRHFHLRLAPEPQDYALAALLVGATLLRWERRAGELRTAGAAYGGESFLGYAALLLGILMAAGHEWLRIVALLLAGLIWLVQAPRRPGVAHYWIGATLCLLGGAATGMLRAFPKSGELNLLPALGLALALLAGAARALSGRAGEARLRRVALEIQPPVLLITAAVAVFSQYHLRSAPWQTGLAILAAAVFFGVRATRENRRDWLNISAAAAGLALPYLGCADMARYRFGDNTLALGFGALAAAWLAVAHLLPLRLWRASSAWLATGFGAFGMLGLVLRLGLGNRPELGWAELAGGALLAAALARAAWQSHARTPSLMGAALLAVLLPFFRTPPGFAPACLHIGSGCVSAAAGCALMLACFAGRRAEFKREISGLYTGSALAAVLWLCAKALALQLQAHRPPLPFIVSLLLVASASYAAALYLRRRAAGRLLFHTSWPLLAAGIALACHAAGCRGEEMAQYPLLWTGVALTALAAAEWAAARRLAWADDYLLRPRLALLAGGSVASALLVSLLVVGHLFLLPRAFQWLALFLAAQLVWHSLRTGRLRFGAALFTLAAAWLLDARALNATSGPLPLLLLSVFLADLALEFLPSARDLLAPLRAPFLAGATLLSLTLAAAAALSVGGNPLGFVQLREDVPLLIAALLAAARAQACAGLALPAAILGYLFALLPCGPSVLFQPWRLSALALSLVLLPYLGRALSARQPRLLRGWRPQLEDASGATQAPWLLLPGLALASSSALLQIASAVSGHPDAAPRVQILAPFAAVAAFALAGLYWRRGALWAAAACLLPAANTFAVATLWGQALLERQLTPAHISGIAAVLTIAVFAAARRVVLRAVRPPLEQAALWLHRGCAALAGLTVALLGMNYLANPDLAQIPAGRFFASGLLALGAGAYFRSAARRPENLLTADGAVMESLWHVSLGLTLWCCALMIPALRTPHTALYALALPAAACWGAAEGFLRQPRDGKSRLTGERFRASAAAFSAFVLLLYVFRLPVQLMLFPQAPLSLHVYHTGAAAALLAGLVLLRLRGLGAAPWTALCGGLALMTGFYFLVSWLPGLSPFRFPMAAGWTAVAAAHLFILLGCQQSPLRSLLQHLGGISAEEWRGHRQLWGLFLTAAAHAAVAAALLQGYRTHGAETTPLLAALVSVLTHLSLVGASGANACRLAALIELLIALHLDFIQPASSPGLIPARHAVWFLLASWLGAAAFWQKPRQPLPARALWTAAGWLAPICAAHLCDQGASTGSGLLIAALLTLAGLLTPVPERAATLRIIALLPLAAPCWLAYFGTRGATGEPADGFRSVLAGAAALLGSGMLVRQAEQTDRALAASRVSCRRLAHDVVALCVRNGDGVARALLGAAFAALALLTFFHGDARHGSLGLMLGLAFVWCLSCAAWFREGLVRDGAAPYSLCLLSLAEAWVLLRRLLFQHFTFWTYEYDIWLSLGVSLAFSAAKRLVVHSQPGLARTITGTVWLLPALQCLWLLSHRMSADLTLLVIGIQAMLFAWHGGGRRDSPYNAVSMLGFVGFVCLLFWAKIDLRCVQAYTIPCGLGVLGLVWLFGSHLQPALRTAVRLFAVLGMLGSCGYYALADNSYPVGFHLTMLVLCLAVMALGPLLRVQLYLYLGFAGFATDLTALVVKQFQSLDRSVQMMGVGALLLLLGIAVVGGAILFKTRRDALLSAAARIRGKLTNWD